MNKKILQKYNEAPKTWGIKIAIALVLAAIIAWSSSTLSFNVEDGGSGIALNIIKGIFTPDTELLFNFTNKGVPYLLLETMCIAFLGTIVGAVFSVPLAFLSATNVVPKPVAWITRVFIMAVRTVPAFVYALMFIRVTGPGAFTGLMTMSVCSIGMISKMFIESIEDLDTRILESLDAAGCTTFQKIRYGILPQLFPDFASTLIYRFDMNLRDATVLGIVGAGGIGSPLMNAMNSYRWNQVGAILCGLIILILIIEVISSKIRNKLTRG